MRHASAVIALLLGCSGGSQPSFEELFVDPCPSVACTAAAPIASPADFAAAVDSSIPWTIYAGYTAGCLAASGDHAVTGTVTVRGSDLELPPNGTNTARPEPRFVVRGASGVTCEIDENLFEFTTCEAITITNTTIRLRTLMIDIHPAQGNFVAVVEVLPPCDAPCTAGQLACEASNVCWETERDHCKYCLGGTRDACACWRDGAFVPDGTACQVDISGDVSVGGECEAGECITPISGVQKAPPA